MQHARCKVQGCPAFLMLAEFGRTRQVQGARYKTQGARCSISLDQIKLIMLSIEFIKFGQCKVQGAPILSMLALLTGHDRCKMQGKGAMCKGEWCPASLSQIRLDQTRAHWVRLGYIRLIKIRIGKHKSNENKLDSSKFDHQIRFVQTRLNYIRLNQIIMDESSLSLIGVNQTRFG